MTGIREGMKRERELKDTEIKIQILVIKVKMNPYNNYIYI